MPEYPYEDEDCIYVKYRGVVYEYHKRHATCYKTAKGVATVCKEIPEFIRRLVPFDAGSAVRLGDAVGVVTSVDLEYICVGWYIPESQYSVEVAKALLDKVQE